MIARECMQLCTSENIEFKYTYPPTCRLITAHAYYAYYPGSLIVHEVPAWCWIMDVLQSLRYLCRYPGLHCLLFRKIWFIEIRYCLWLYTLPNLVHYCNWVAPSCTLASFPGLHRFYLPFHNNTRERSSDSVYCCERKQDIKTGEAWDRG